MLSPNNDRANQQIYQIKHKKVDAASSSEEKTDLLYENENDDKTSARTKVTKQQNRKSRPFEDMYEYIMDKPTSKLAFLYFLVSIFMPVLLGIWYFVANNLSFKICGIFGILNSLYALNHFRVLLSLRKEIDTFSKLNKSFLKENRMLRHEVDILYAANNELQETQNKLKDTNMKQKENNRKFRLVQESMKAVNLDNMEGISSIRAKANKIGKSFNKTLLQRERDVLYTLFERFERVDEEDGMNQQEFDMFVEMLPNSYKERFDRLATFKKLAKGKLYVDYNDFSACLDVFAEMHIENCDIDFEITQISNDNQSKIKNRQVNIIKKSKPGMIFTQKDIVYHDEVYDDNDRFLIFENQHFFMEI